MPALDRVRASLILNANAPVGTGGNPGTQLTALNAASMKLKLTSTASTNATSGTEITGTGYTAGGQAVGNQSSASTNGSDVTVPAVAALTWTNTSGSSWSIVSAELTAGDGTRVWWGPFTGQPISVPNNATFTVAIAGITLSLG